MLTAYQTTWLHEKLVAAVEHIYINARYRDVPFGYDQLEDAYSAVTKKPAFSDDFHSEIMAWITANTDDPNGTRGLLVRVWGEDEWEINEELVSGRAREKRTIWLQRTRVPGSPRKRRSGGVVFPGG